MVNYRLLFFFFFSISLVGLQACRTGSDLYGTDSLASNMAKMEQEMNIIFRYIEYPEKISDLIQATDNLLKLQIDSSKQIPPISPGLQEEYAKRSKDSILLIGNLKADLEQGNLKEAKTQLLKLDKHRRKCHSIFG